MSTHYLYPWMCLRQVKSQCAAGQAASISWSIMVNQKKSQPAKHFSKSGDIISVVTHLWPPAVTIAWMKTKAPRIVGLGVTLSPNFPIEKRCNTKKI